MVAHLDAVTCLAVDPNGMFLLSGSKWGWGSSDGGELSSLGLTCLSSPSPPWGPPRASTWPLRARAGTRDCIHGMSWESLQ